MNGVFVMRLCDLTLDIQLSGRKGPNVFLSAWRKAGG